MTDPQTRIKRTIAEQMVDGPCWTDSFHDVKAVRDAMVESGELAHVSGRNMVGLTRRGAERYGLTVQDHNLFDHERELHKHHIAEVVANGGSVESCASALDMSESYCGDLWHEIVTELGPQAI